MKTSHIICLLLYIDDILIAFKDTISIKKLKANLSSRFEMKDLGQVTKILDMKIMRVRSKDILYLSLSDYVCNVVERFGLMHAKSVGTPLAPFMNLSFLQCPCT